MASNNSINPTVSDGRSNSGERFRFFEYLEDFLSVVDPGSPVFGFPAVAAFCASSSVCRRIVVNFFSISSLAAIGNGIL
jgi:hypothetical protein